MALYYTHQGSSALSEFRSQRLASKIGAKEVTAKYVHYVALKEALNDESTRILDSLLTYDDVPPIRAPTSAGDASTTYTLYVWPRKGTISPWSSKATSIAYVCGLKQNIRRIERGTVFSVTTNEKIDDAPWTNELYDRMTQILTREPPDLDGMFNQGAPGPATVITIYGQGVDPHRALEEANRQYGLALDASEIDYLAEVYGANGPLRRDPYLEELFMFAQINSEHCRHKQFNASWTINDVEKPHSLFEMIRNTHKQHPAHVLSAYSDNAAVLEGAEGSHLAPDWATGEWTQCKETVHYLAKVETHNHPTGVAPFPGAATGSGGEIRDEGSAGRGSKPKTGLSGFAVSDLNIPGFRQPWELDIGKPNHIASSLEIMLEAPIGAAAFNNEFGRPCTTGFWRTMLTKLPIGKGADELRGYHKPIMIAGGLGSVRPSLMLKDSGLVQPGTFLIVIGGPAMLIGLGGGAASSGVSSDQNADLDFASVQRGNAEVQRRAQSVLDQCSAMGSESPILFIHDVGAGGLSNAFPELVHDADLGATFELREIDNANPSMSPMQIWCCEAQERYVVAVAQESLSIFKTIADRERCGYSIAGKTTGPQQGGKRLILLDRDSQDHPAPIDLPMSVLFGKPPKMRKIVESRLLRLPSFDASLSTYLPEIPTHGLLQESVNRVLALPSVGSKSFLITIGDRTVGGLVVRDQMVGPWQIPVADVSVTATSLTLGVRTGEAMAMGEKPALALISPTASARMVVAESMMNLAAADLSGRTGKIRLSANWMSASSHPGEGAAIYEAVEAIGMELCPELGISIPVGKDSMSMKMRWTEKESKAKEVAAPLSLIVTAFAPVRDIRKTWTPTLRRLEDVGETLIMFVDLAEGRKALGGSALAQVFGQVGDVVPDVHNAQLLKDYFDAMEQLKDFGIVLAYHDVSDGGLFTALVEMMFAGRCGMGMMMDDLCHSKDTKAVMEALWNEELGGVFQIRKRDEIEFHRAFATCGPPAGLIKKIGRVSEASKEDLAIYHNNILLYRASRSQLQQRWASTSYQMQRLRDNPACADDEFNTILDSSDPGLSYNPTFTPKDKVVPALSTLMDSLWRNKPRVAVLREEGINGHSEMAFAFMTAGFTAVDVHMSDLISGRVLLDSFIGLAAPGGFSFGDVLGAGRGLATSILLSPKLRREFQTFFERQNTFTLGICNSCQALSRLRELIPGTENWPVFERNASEQYEARVCMVEVLDNPASPSVFLHGMAGSKLPIAVAHGEGRASFADPRDAQTLLDNGLVSVRYVDNHLNPTEAYPANPNGSPMGITGVRSRDGRVLALMPHPERTVLGGIGSYIPESVGREWSEKGPWSRLFESARRWVG